MVEIAVVTRPITTGRSVGSVSPRGDELVLELDDGTTKEVDHLLLATGYRVDLTRYAFPAPELLARVRTRYGSPVLATGLESSVRGLPFLGAPAAQSFGPVNLFVCGTWASARGLTRAVVGRRAPRAGSIIGQHRASWMPYAAYRALGSRAKVYVRSEVFPDGSRLLR
jgi:hypothetical protein